MKVKCSHCHGTGKVTCSLCKGRGKRKCPICGGSGHACPVCSKEYSHVGQHGRVKDEFGNTVYCPNCHGDYDNKKYTCWMCGGDGIIDCSKTSSCPVCDGTGKVNKMSKGNQRVFRAFSLAFGFSGLQYLYVGRWLLFSLQFVTFAMFVAAIRFSKQIATFIDGFGLNVDCNNTAWLICVILGACLVLNILLGMLLVKCDGRGGFLQTEYKKGWFWLFFLLFGFTGAHLAYTKERLLLCVHLLWLTLPGSWIVFLSITVGEGKEIGNIVPLLVLGWICSVVEAGLAQIVNAIFGTEFLKEKR